MVIKKIDMEEYSVRFDDRSFDVRRCFRIRIYHADKPEFCDLAQIDDKFYDAKDLKDMADACWFALEKMKGAKGRDEQKRASFPCPANPVRKNRVLSKPSKHVVRRRKIFW